MAKPALIPPTLLSKQEKKPEAKPEKTPAPVLSSPVIPDPIADVALTEEQHALVENPPPPPPKPPVTESAKAEKSAGARPVLRVLEKKKVFISGRPINLRPGATIDPNHYSPDEYKTIAGSVKTEPV